MLTTQSYIDYKEWCKYIEIHMNDANMRYDQGVLIVEQYGKDNNIIASWDGKHGEITERREISRLEETEKANNIDMSLIRQIRQDLEYWQEHAS